MKLLILIFLTSFYSLFAMETYTVTAKRIEIIEDDSASTTQVIKPTAVNAAAPISEAISSNSSIVSNPTGKYSTISLHGANSEHTLVLFDQIPVNDEISPGGGFIFKHLPSSMFRQVEVVKGAQSILYGPQTLSGVVNLIPIKKVTQGPSKLYTSVGSHKTQTLSYLVAPFSSSKQNHALRIDYEESDGFSVAKSDTPIVAEKDGHKHRSLSLFNTVFFKGHKIDSSLYLAKTNTDSDSSGYSAGDDPNSTEEEFKTWYRLSSLFSSGKLLNSLNYALVHYDRELDNLPGGTNQTRHRYTFLTTSHSFNYTGRYLADRRNEFILVLDSKISKGKTQDFKKNETASGLGILYTHQISNTSLELGGRVDQLEDVGERFTTKLSVKQRFKNGLAFISAGNAYKKPTLYQKHSEYGTKSLSPEKARIIDSDFIYAPSSHYSLGLNLFRIEFDNLINYDFSTQKFLNTQKAYSQGGNLSFKVDFFGLTMKLSSGITEARNETLKKELSYRPRYKSTASLNYQHNKYALSYHSRYVGSRKDSLDNRMDPYMIHNLGATYNYAKNIALTITGSNIFDKEYEQIPGYSTPGRTYSFHLKANF